MPRLSDAQIVNGAIKVYATAPYLCVQSIGDTSIETMVRSWLRFERKETLWTHEFSGFFVIVNINIVVHIIDLIKFSPFFGILELFKGVVWHESTSS